MWTISLPVAVAVSSKKKFNLNLNWYRNAHFQVLNKAKAEFERVVGPLLRGVPKLDRITLEYVHFHGSGTVPDTNNVCTVADKFFADTLVSRGILQDDHPKYLTKTTFRFGGIDRKNPRIEVTISSSYPERTRDMKLMTVATLDPADVTAALKDWFIKQIPQAKTTDNITFTPTANGGYEVRFEAELGAAVAPSDLLGRGAKGQKQPALPSSSLPQVTLAAKPAALPDAKAEALAQVSEALGLAPGEAKPAATSAPLTPLFSLDSAAPSTTAPTSAEPPPLPPPSNGGLFAEFTRPSNK